MPPMLTSISLHSPITSRGQVCNQAGANQKDGASLVEHYRQDFVRLVCEAAASQGSIVEV